MGRIAIPFWDHVAKGDGCWEWTGSRRAGYGRAIVNQKSVRAHRRAWVLTNGPIPDGLFVLHKCDNPPCVRPDHLFLGTQLDNRRDAVAKGRQASGANHASHLHPELRQGTNNGNAKLTEEIVREIRLMEMMRGDLSRMARRYSVSKTVIWKAYRGKSWRHI